jgi:hypothetical protein
MANISFKIAPTLLFLPLFFNGNYVQLDVYFVCVFDETTTTKPEKRTNGIELTTKEPMQKCINFLWKKKKKMIKRRELQ